MKDIKFQKEKILPLHIGMQNVHLSVCLAVKME